MFYDDPTTKKKLRTDAFKTLQTTAVETISTLATLTTDKADLKTKILANLFYWKDHQGKHYRIRNQVQLGNAITKHLVNPHATLDFYKDEFVFFIGTNLLFPDRDDSAIDVRDFSKIKKELPSIPSSTASATATATATF